jgi:hypothetical protein
MSRAKGKKREKEVSKMLGIIDFFDPFAGQRSNWLGLKARG